MAAGGGQCRLGFCSVLFCFFTPRWEIFWYAGGMSSLKPVEREKLNQVGTNYLSKVFEDAI
jgi:hypothetical protein